MGAMALPGAGEAEAGVRVPEEEEEEEEDLADLFDQEFLMHMESLKQACQMMPGAEVRLKTSTLASSSSKFQEEEYDDDDADDDDDHDALLLSIERRFLVKDAAGAKRKRVEEEEEEEEEVEEVDHDVVLSLGEERCGALDLVKASKHAKTTLEDDAGGRRSKTSLEDDAGGERTKTSLEDDAGGEHTDAPIEDDPLPLCSFLPAQVDDEEFEESALPLVVHEEVPSVPDGVQAVTDALMKNRACQQSLREVLRGVERKLQENHEMQRRAVSLVEYQKACTRKFCGFTDVANASVELIATKPPVKRKGGGEFKVKGPPENPDVEVYRKLQSQLPAEFNVKKWAKKETQALAKGVRQQLQEIRVRAIMEDSDDEEQDFDAQMRSIGESEEEELKKGAASIDWSEVARIYVSGRSAWECKLQWENNEDPTLNSKPWTKAEDKKLLATAQAHDMLGWAAIAEDLNTQRTPAQCAIRYQRSLNASILRSNWTLAEDEELQAAVEKLGEKDWQTVAACMEGRLGSQCMSRWTKVLHPDRHRRGRWIAEEDTRLKWAVSVYGPRGWKNIAAHVPGRSDVQCRERWCNVLDPAVKIDEWTPEEDVKLEDLVLKYGRHRWAAVGAELGRTDNQCFRHWKLLHSEHQESFKKDMVILRAALSTNFVGREKERPDLGFQDFLPPPGVGERASKTAAAPKRRTRVSREKPPPKPRTRPPPKEKPPPKPRKSKRKSPEPSSEKQSSEKNQPSSEVNENHVVSLSSEVVENQGAEPSSQVVHSRKRRAPPQPGARASKKRKPPPAEENHEDAPVEVNHEDAPVEVNHEDVSAEVYHEDAPPEESHEDAPLIVYTRRKDRFSSSGKSSLDHSNEISSTAERGTVAASEEPTLRRHRKKLSLPN